MDDHQTTDLPVQRGALPRKIGNDGLLNGRITETPPSRASLAHAGR